MNIAAQRTNLVRRVKLNKKKEFMYGVWRVRRLMRTVEVSVSAVLEPIRHKELIFIVIWVDGEVNNGDRVGKASEVIKTVTSPLLARTGLKVEKIINIYHSVDLPLVPQK